MKSLSEWTTEELIDLLCDSCGQWCANWGVIELLDEVRRRERERFAVICDAVAELYGEDGQAATICAGAIRRVR